MKLTKQDLINFEKDILKEYEAGKIRGSVHLSGGNEEELIKIFENIKKNDWVFSNHRSHYHALLKTRNPKWVKQEIMNGNSIHINSAEHNFFTSAIVGGQIPIALGVALGLKLMGNTDRVWCFLGDMASAMGIYKECFKYATGHNLRITFVEEDNGLGVNTPTAEVWGNEDLINECKVETYWYKRKYPHHGIGKWIMFPEEKKSHDGRTF